MLEKVQDRVHICSIGLCFDTAAVPSAITNWQLFYNTQFPDAIFLKSYASLSSIQYSEESITSTSGTSYKQKVSFSFPNADAQRSERIAYLQKSKFIKLKLTNGLDLVIGRNDYYQNSAPTFKIKSNEQTTELEIETQSIFPAGFMPTSENGEYVPEIPIAVMTPQRITFNYSIPEVTIPEGLKILDIENLNNPSKVIQFTEDSPTTITLIDNCAVDDLIKITGLI